METVTGKPRDIVFDFNAKIPEKYQKEIRKACYLLKNEGCESVYLFGSMITGKIHNGSDIDIGIKGMPKGNFFRIHAKLSENLAVDFDLIDLDFDYQFFNLLEELGELKKIG